MWIEILPRIVGAVGLLVGLGLLTDALVPDRPPPVERRRRPRAPRSRVGQTLFALGVLALAGTLAVGETWPGATRGVTAAVGLLALGVALDARHLIGFLAGSARARPVADDAAPGTEGAAPRAPARRGRRSRRGRGGSSGDDPLPWPLDADD